MSDPEFDLPDVMADGAVQADIDEQLKTVAEVDSILQYFRCGHLPEALRTISAPFGLLALEMVVKVPRNPERTVCLRKLLEAKDCAVRAALTEAR